MVWKIIMRYLSALVCVVQRMEWNFKEISGHSHPRKWHSFVWKFQKIYIRSEIYETWQGIIISLQYAGKKISDDYTTSMMWTLSKPNYPQRRVMLSRWDESYSKLCSYLLHLLTLSFCYNEHRPNTLKCYNMNFLLNRLLF